MSSRSRGFFSRRGYPEGRARVCEQWDGIPRGCREEVLGLMGTSRAKRSERKTHELVAADLLVQNGGVWLAWISDEVDV